MSGKKIFIVLVILLSISLAGFGVYNWLPEPSRPCAETMEDCCLQKDNHPGMIWENLPVQFFSVSTAGGLP